MGEEKQSGVGNGNPDISSGKIHGWSKSDFTSNGNLVRFDYFGSNNRTSCQRFTGKDKSLTSADHCTIKVYLHVSPISH